jgi:PAS domain S-box-containing protein
MMSQGPTPACGNPSSNGPDQGPGSVEERRAVVGAGRENGTAGGEASAIEGPSAGDDLYRRIVETVSEGIWAVDADQRTTFINARLAERLGYRPEELVGRPAWEIVFPEDIAEGDRRWAERSRGEEGEAEFRLRCRDGAEVWFHAATSPIRDPDGRFAGAVGIFSDITERRRADEALRRSERQSRLLADTMPHIVWTATGEGQVDYFNGRWYEYTGLSPEETLSGMGWRSVVHPDDVGRLLDLRDPAVEVGQGFQADIRLRDREGNYRWHIVRSVPVCDESGQVIRRFGTATDIDPRWRAQQEVVRLNRDLRARVDELETLFETVPIGIAIGEDTACARLRANPALERLLETAPGSNMSMTAPAGERPGHLTFRRDGREVAPEDLPMQVAAREGRPVIGDTLEIAFADGRTKVIHGNAAPLFDEDGRPRGAIGAFMDMTEWRRVEAALADSEERLRLAVQANGLGLFDRDLTGNILRWSARAKDIFGLPPDAPMSFDRFLAMIHPDDREMVRTAIECALDPAVAEDYDAEYRCVRDDGSTRWVHARGRAIFEVRDGARRPMRIVGTVLDITARKEAEVQLMEAKEAAETANLAKDRFLAALSHELRTPLAPVVTAVALLEMTPGLSPEMQEYLAMIRRHIGLETRLIDDLLDLSRVISGKLRLDRRPTQLNAVVEHVMDIVGGDIHERGLAVEMTLAARPDLVDADPARLQQVIWNLVKNAAKFTPAGGMIRVATRPAGEGRVEVEVRDTGKGISPEALPHIFDAFEQGEPAVTRQFGGLGLGLSIAKAVVDRHGGTIRAASDGPGLGSTFVVTLPLIARPTDRPETVDAPPADGPAGRLRVLLVEDHVDTGRATSRLLERFGYKVAWADCVAAALRRAESEPFDIVVSDLGLPDGDGYALMRQIAERHGTPGIALSGFGMEGDILRGREAGFLEHLVKPVDIATLDQTIRRVARLARAQ